MQTIEGKVAVVTGGARGLGEAIARELSAGCAKVAILDIRKDLAEEVAQDLRSGGTDAVALQVDLTRENAIREAIDLVVERFGGIDYLINNAGTDKTLSCEEMSVEEFNQVVQVNLEAPFITSKYVFPVMRQRGGGHIVNIVSTAAKRAWANASAYHASKWGLLGLSHALHVEGRPHAIKVTALVAGGMKTPFLLDRFPDIDTSTLQDPKNVAETVHFILTQPAETVIPEVMVIPVGETSWP
jgi:NAD(P)-dependent dehydrogenase (short-subunit alcohol dehydrogenase family)